MEKIMNYKAILPLLPCLLLVGCATTTAINYKLDNTVKGDKTISKNVVIDVFNDLRSDEEKAGLLTLGKEIAQTKDKDFKPDVNVQISQMITKHLEKSGLFNSVALEDIDDDIDQNVESMTKLTSEGKDIAIVGNINHFYGYQTKPNQLGGMFGLVGTFTEAFANEKKVGAKTEYVDVKVIDLNKQSVVWQGNIEYEFDEKDTFYDGQVIYSLRGLKEANKKLVEKLESIL